MKIFILHGDNSLKSYERLKIYIKKAKEKEYDVQKITKDIQPDDIEKIFSTNLLFNSNRIIVVYDYNILNKNILNWIKKHKDSIDSNIIIYQNNNLTQKIIKSLPNVEKIEEFNLPKLTWSFLDSFYPGNSKNSLLILHKIIKNQPIEFIFALLSKQLRDLYWVKADSKSIPYPSWRIDKLRRQAIRFENGKLEEIIDKMSEIDIKYKTSKEELINLLDYLIIIYLK